MKLEAALKARGLNPYRARTACGQEPSGTLNLSPPLRRSPAILLCFGPNTLKSCNGSRWRWLTLKTSGRGDARNPRRRIHINLRGQSRVFQKYEAVDDLQETGLYGLGVKSSSLADRPGQGREESIRQDNAVFIHKAILTSTLARLQAVPLGRKKHELRTYLRRNSGADRDQARRRSNLAE